MQKRKLVLLNGDMEISAPPEHVSRLGSAFPRRVAWVVRKKFFDNTKARPVYWIVRLGASAHYNLHIKTKGIKFVRWRRGWWLRIFKRKTERYESSGY